MTSLYFLVVSVLFQGEPINVAGVATFDSLAECQYRAGLFVQRVVQPDWVVTATCNLVEVNDA